MAETDINLPLSYKEKYQSYCSIISGGANWGSTGYEVFQTNLSKIKLRFINHISFFENIISSWLTIGY